MNQGSETKNNPGTFQTPSVKVPDDSLYLPIPAELSQNPEQNGDQWAMDLTVADLGHVSQLQIMQWNGFKKAVKERMIKEGQGQAYFVKGKLACSREIPIGFLYQNLKTFVKPKGVTRVAWKSR